jgi:hypothetical protein
MTKNVPNNRQQPEFRRFECEQQEHKSIFHFAVLRFAGSLRGASRSASNQNPSSTILTLPMVRRREN